MSNIKVGDIINFTCNGRGRGNHYGVTALVTKLNRKTFECTEQPRSYAPGTLWRIHFDNDSITFRFTLWYSAKQDHYHLMRDDDPKAASMEPEYIPFRTITARDIYSAARQRDRILEHLTIK